MQMLPDVYSNFGNLITYDFSVKQIDDDTKIQWGIVDFEIGDFCGWWPLWISNGTDFSSHHRFGRFHHKFLFSV